MKKRFLLNIQYDGSNFHGWQSQKDVRTVQAEIEKKLSIIHKQHTPIVAAGRTDAKVNATDQYAHFDSEMALPAETYEKALNSLLPDDILIKRANIVPPDFHARYQAYERCYQYLITADSSPFLRSYSYYCSKLPSLTLINNYAKRFEGEHDFFAFSKFNPDVPNTICHVKKAHFVSYKKGYIFTICANRYLHNMVRRIIGTIFMLAKKDVGEIDLFQQSLLLRVCIW